VAQFAVFGSCLAFSCAAIETNRDTEKWVGRVVAANPASKYTPSTWDIRAAQFEERKQVRLLRLPSPRVTHELVTTPGSHQLDRTLASVGSPLLCDVPLARGEVLPRER
jgi:hypothetical protein